MNAILKEYHDYDAEADATVRRYQHAEDYFQQRLENRFHTGNLRFSADFIERQAANVARQIDAEAWALSKQFAEDRERRLQADS